MAIDETKRRRRGPSPLAAEDKREHTVSVRLNIAELAQLDKQRESVQLQRGEYLRAAALHKLPPTIPALNREAWSELARTAANLNQIARRLNEGGMVGEGLRSELAECARLVRSLRSSLIGAKEFGR